MEYKIQVADLRKKLSDLKSGDLISLSGTVYTARDAAHKRICELIEKGEELPFSLKDAAIYYAGPTPAKNGMAIGSCGPTTSGRMDVYTPLLLEKGLVCMIGKGERNSAVIDSMKKNGAVYFCAIGGAGALAASCIKSCEVIAFEDLGCESVKKLYMEDFPLIVAIDSEGNDIFKKKKENE